MPSLLAYNIRIYSKVEDYATENKTHVNTQIRVRENGGSLDFNFISLLNSAIDENWVCWHRLLQFILGKGCHLRCSELCKLFVNGKFAKRFHFFYARIDLFSIFICLLYSLWATVGLLHHQFWLCVCVNFRLCCTHFSCHWRKICNVSRQLTQISRRQRYPCPEFLPTGQTCPTMCALTLSASTVLLNLFANLWKMPAALHCTFIAGGILCKQRHGGNESPFSGVTSYGSLGEGCRKARLGVLCECECQVVSIVSPGSGTCLAILCPAWISDLACFFVWTLQSSQIEQCSLSHFFLRLRD